MKLLSGSCNEKLSREISRNLKTKLSDIKIIRFADSEVYCEIKENMRGKDVFLIQGTSYPANYNIMELLICVDAIRRASAKVLQLFFHIMHMQDKIEKFHQDHLLAPSF